MKIYSLISVVSVLLFGPCMESVFAKEQTMELVRQPRNVAMGGIGVGLADDEFSLFNNPAGLAGMENRGFRPLGVMVEGSMDTYSSLEDVMEMVNNFSLSSLNNLMNKDVAFRASQVPMILLPHFAISYVVDTQISLNQFNMVNPTLNLGFMTTHGVQAGTAWSFKSGRRAPDEWRVGFAAKLLFRKGGFYDVGTAGVLRATSDPVNYLDELVGQYGTGFGGDVGVQYVRKLPSEDQILFGSSITDIANTKFSEAKAMTIPMSFNFGVGYIKKLNETRLSFGLDMKNALAATALSNKIHVGGEADLGFINIQAGLNQLNATYGAGFDFFMLKVLFMSYAEELGAYYHQQYSRRYAFQVNFNMPI